MHYGQQPITVKKKHSAIVALMVENAPDRTTYQDHWFDNFGNAIVGHFFAQVNPLKSLHISEDLLKTFTQVLIPLDHDMFWLSRVLRICESLEKHSGVTFKN